DFVGEECRGVSGRDEVSDPNAPQRLDLVCGKDKNLAGVVRGSLLPLELPPPGAARREAVERAGSQTFAGAGIAARLNCQKGRWVTGENGSEAMLQLCETRAGNWPQIVATVPAGRILYQAEGVPVLVPVMAAAIAKQSGETITLN